MRWRSAPAGAGCSRQGGVATQPVQNDIASLRVGGDGGVTVISSAGSAAIVSTIR